MNDIYAQIGRLSLRLDAVEKRLYKLEDVVNEILRRSAGLGALVPTPFGPADKQQFSSDSHLEGRAVETGGRIFVPTGGRKAVKRKP